MVTIEWNEWSYRVEGDRQDVGNNYLEFGDFYGFWPQFTDFWQICRFDNSPCLFPYFVFFPVCEAGFVPF